MLDSIDCPIINHSRIFRDCIHIYIYIYIYIYTYIYIYVYIYIYIYTCVRKGYQLYCIVVICFKQVHEEI